ncbi:MAG: hypothetical protein ACRENG_29190 [bacterium]
MRLNSRYGTQKINPPMHILLRTILMIFLTYECLALLLGTTTAYSQETKSLSSPSIAFIVQLGMSDDGAVTSEWIEAIRQRHDDEALAAILASKKRLSEEEALWAGLIKRKVSTWLTMIDSLQIPFQAITPPDTVAILLGNLGGEDAFVYSHVTICFDLNKLHSQYGAASTNVNSSRIDRFFAHEFTHLLHKAWRKKHGLELESPFEYALWECLTEGLGNYRSLSDKWILEGGKLTPHAQEVLSRVQPIFVKRLSALEQATAEEAAPLLEGLSMGPFDQKWGALTVALWLAQEAKGDDHNLQQWVEAGLSGVLILAQKYLPEDLKGEMPKIDAQ